MSMNIDAVVKLTASVAGQQAIDGVTKSLGGVQSMAKTAALAVAGIGSGIGFAVLKDKFDDMISSMNRIKDSSEKIGTTVEKFGALAQAAKITGDDIGMLETGIIKMNKALAGSDDDTKGAAHALDAIGLNIAKLRAMDPADAFTQIAKSLDNFEASGSKTAVVMDIFGKSGAQLLPFLNDYVEIGEQVTKVTQDQADMAEEYERNTRKLAAAKQELYRVISTQMLPVANDFVKALVQVNNQTGGVKDAVKGLAADGSLKQWFEMGFNGLTYLAQAGEYVARIFSGIGKTLAASIAQASAVLSGDFKGAMAIGGAWLDDMKKLMSGETFGEKLRAQFQANRAETESGVKPTQKAQAKLTYQSSVATKPDAAPKADPFETELQNMARDASKFKWMTEHIQQYEDKITSAKEAQIQFDVEQGKFKDLTDTQKTMLLMQAAAVDKYAEALRQAKEAQTFDQATKAIMTETATMGMNRVEKQLALAAQELENKGIKEGTELFDKLIAKRKEALVIAEKESRTMGTGARDAINGYVDAAMNGAQQMKDVFGNAFKGMEDALVDFVKTGKLDFQSLADSIISDLIRIAVQRQIMAPLVSGLGGMFGFANGGVMTADGPLPLNKYANGGIASSPQLALFGEGKTPEAFVPLPDGRNIPVKMQGEGGGNVVVNVVNNAGNTKATAQERQGSDGSRIIDVMIEQVKASIAADISRGVGTVTSALERTYGANRAAGAY